jgi:adenylylsulfate kinase
VNVGALGNLNFEKGIYAYVGSAKKGLSKRIQRHLRKYKRKFWHIDYLLENESVKIFEIFYKEAEKPFECKLAEKINEIGVPINGFGSSDCKCGSHLFKINSYQSLIEFVNENEFKEAFKLREGWCVWITGLPGSGKSVVSKALLALLEKEGIHAQLLSSDSLRKIMTPKPKYTLEERDAVYATLVYIAKLLTENGINVVIDATGNLRRYRENARAQIPKFIEAYLECPLEICMHRESKRIKTHFAPKRIYEKALKGKAPTVPGIGQPYEEPLKPEVRVDAARLSPEECAKKIMMIIVKSYY